MAKAIDWLYHRKSCVTCQKAADHRAARGTAVAETVIGNKVKLGPADALALIRDRGIEKIVSSKGAKTVELKVADAADDAAIFALVIGPTGNLRAPAAVVGTTLLIGFHPAADDAALG